MGAKPGRMKGNEQGAKYRKPEKKHGKPGGREGGDRGKPKGRTGAQRRPLKRRKLEEGNGRTGGQVAGGGTEGDERNRTGSGKCRGRERKASTCGTAVGAKRGRAKGNEQEAEYREPGRKAWETRPERTGKTEGTKVRAEHCGSHCEAEAGRSGKGRSRG